MLRQPRNDLIYGLSNERDNILNSTKWHLRYFLVLIIEILVLISLIGCEPSTANLEAVNYTPLPGDDWAVSTPAEQGLDPMLVANLYHNAAELERLYGLLVVKNGYLISEDYFNEGAVDRKNQLQSATKSFA